MNVWIDRREGMMGGQYVPRWACRWTCRCVWLCCGVCCDEERKWMEGRGIERN